MTPDILELFDEPAERSSDVLSVRRVARTSQWSVSDIVCEAGPEARPFEERHDGFSIAAVVSGTFTYHGENGRSLLHPGALLLGNHGRCFQCGHDHSIGDRCLAISLSSELFEEIAAARAGSSRFVFPVASLPAIREFLPRLTRLEAMGRNPGIEDAVIGLAEAVVGHLSGHVASAAHLTSRDERRIAEVIRHIDACADEPMEIDALARLARMSKYHFIRVFRAVIGLSPYRYVLALRMRRSAARIALSSENIASIAYEAGFGDLSTFNSGFREVFGMSPTAYRRRMLRA
ncbi:helix-turn-helix transcriptional regulator [Phreatobacter aquaticus]|uniref:Helix-turn-helix transcriptional regulator n=1 Tax=Phreatobacter aquaticus TaxID=2570229 RepID=A0A4D7QIR3_9HYPH|nr:helix-turn-helix transcriptional regulator [Phreatobacter aquaticus]